MRPTHDRRHHEPIDAAAARLFATVRELCLYFSRNQTRASYAAIGLLYPEAFSAHSVTSGRAVSRAGQPARAGAWCYEAELRAGVDEVALADHIGPVWERLVAQAFPSDAEVSAEVGNSNRGAC